MNHLKVFTLEQANQMIPTLTRMIDEIREKRDEILKQEVQIDALEIVADPTTKEGGSPELQKAMDLYNRAVNRFYSLVDEIHSLGCFLKDIDMGLIDFYMNYQGRIVYLCWAYGEKQAGYWHEIGKGFGSREPLEPEDLA